MYRRCRACTKGAPDEAGQARCQHDGRRDCADYHRRDQSVGAYMQLAVKDVQLPKVYLGSRACAEGGPDQAGQAQRQHASRRDCADCGCYTAALPGLPGPRQDGCAGRIHLDGALGLQLLNGHLQGKQRVCRCSVSVQGALK